jgi:hypothetical protein
LLRRGGRGVKDKAWCWVRKFRSENAGGLANRWGFSLWLEADLPEWFSPMEREQVEEELRDGLLDIMETPPLESFAGDEKPHLVQFIRFCRLGSFEIL